jgi:hypothetical protein
VKIKKTLLFILFLSNKVLVEISLEREIRKNENFELILEKINQNPFDLIKVNGETFLRNVLTKNIKCNGFSSFENLIVLDFAKVNGNSYFENCKVEILNSNGDLNLKNSQIKFIKTNGFFQSNDLVSFEVEINGDSYLENSKIDNLTLKNDTDSYFEFFKAIKIKSKNKKKFKCRIKNCQIENIFVDENIDLIYDEKSKIGQIKKFIRT